MEIEIKSVSITSAQDFYDLIIKHNIDKNKDCYYKIYYSVKLNNSLLNIDNSLNYTYYIKFYISNSYFKPILDYFIFIYNNHNIIKLLLDSGCGFHIYHYYGVAPELTENKIKTIMKIYENINLANNIEPLLTINDLDLMIKNNANTLKIKNLTIIKHHLLDYFINFPDMTFTIPRISINPFPKIILQYLSTKQVLNRLAATKTQLINQI